MGGSEKLCKSVRRFHLRVLDIRLNNFLPSHDFYALLIKELSLLKWIFQKGNVKISVFFRLLLHIAYLKPKGKNSIDQKRSHLKVLHCFRT
jgi:hypothetical protein